MRKHIVAILWKQMKDTLKNKTILLQFILYFIYNVLSLTFKSYLHLYGIFYIIIKPVWNLQLLQVDSVINIHGTINPHIHLSLLVSYLIFHIILLFDDSKILVIDDN